MTNLPREVVMDLLPMYLAGEGSPETRAWVEAGLEADPDLASAASQLQAGERLQEIPVPLTEEDEMEAYRQANKLMVVRTLGLAAIIAFTVVLCAAMALIPMAVLVLARMS